MDSVFFDSSRGLHGPRGLKLLVGDVHQLPPVSRPSRAAWIETLLSGSNMNPQTVAAFTGRVD
tara:strand:- start:26923 stop:27111 length:189 start_codon:yes stop_codon:yes gene_type:complete